MEILPEKQKNIFVKYGHVLKDYLNVLMMSLSIKKEKITMILFVVMLVVLSGCGKNVADDLQSKKWNVVSDKGSSGKVEFGKEKVTFDLGVMSVGFDYKVDGEEITLENESIISVFEIVKDGKEYKLNAKNDETKNGVGNLTLSASKD